MTDSVKERLSLFLFWILVFKVAKGVIPHFCRTLFLSSESAGSRRKLQLVMTYRMLKLSSSHDPLGRWTGDNKHRNTRH